MIRKLLMLAVAAAIIGFGVYWVVTIPGTIPASALPAYTPNVANGQTVFNAGGCASCHAVPGEDRKMLGGGLALPSPFGTFYAPNISPHPQNGIGNWAEAQFVTAVLKGTSPSGEHYFPAFPYGSYRLAKTEDVRDLFAFIKTLPPLSGKVRPHELPFPFDIRRNVGGWKLLFFADKPFEPDPKQSAEWNRGAYLVNGWGHCAECHSPRNPLGGIVASQRYAGGPNPEGEGWVPNITQKRLGSWREKDFAYFLETGETPDGDTTGGVMAKVIRNTAQLTPADRQAMAVYLKSLPARDGPLRPAKKKAGS
ncbi:MAG: alkylated DNA repair protein [Proteobacteria bacterium SG_bin9]|nr:MAG: alkylated DNA repair protein [Proteobacteria bacterium SG_bin9]